MSGELSRAEQTKFALFFGGIDIPADVEAFLMRPYGDRPLTLADYASTSGVSLVLEDNVWVNAPIAAFNANFVFAPRHRLLLDGERLVVRDLDRGWDIPARFAPVPAYHDQTNALGERFTDYVHTHTDRARLSPVRGCAMRCKFCDIPYEFKGEYLPKPVERLLEAARRALEDPVQPAAHLLISGGTPGKPAYEYLRDTYRVLIGAFKDVDVDVMMAPMPEVVNLDELIDVGVNELSLNLEIWDREIAARIIPQKHKQGLAAYMDFIADAVDRLGRGRVRSMLMVGLESAESTLDAVEELSRLGCVPVLSPFRPDPITELATTAPPTAAFMTRVFLEARERAGRHGMKLGPRCIPCSHNTMTLDDGSGDYTYHERRPTLV